jgi:hypothetical protein
MNIRTVAVLRALTIGVVFGSMIFCNLAVGESLVFRFEAGQSRTGIVPPEGSVAALAAAMPKLTGTFGFDNSAPVAAGTGIPGRVSFGVYDTGFITVDGIDMDRVPGEFAVKVTDGVTQTDDPRKTIVDEISLSTRAISTDAPVDALTLRLRFLDADRLQGVDLPRLLDLNDIANMSLSFSTRTDSMANRRERGAATVDLVGLVHFHITVIERVE